MKLIDTNVFIYAVGRQHKYKESCVELVNKLERGEIEANIDTELHQEILYRFWQVKRPREGIAIVDRLLVGFPTPFPITFDVIGIAKDIFATVPELAPRDAIHGAVVIVNRLEGIISTDGGMGSIPGVTRIDPMDL